MTPPPPFLPGDIVCFHGANWLSAAIQWATKSPGETPVFANHVGVFTSAIEITEALWTVTTRPACESLAGSAYQIWRNTTLTCAQRQAVAQKALTYVGREYGVGKILLHLGDALLTKAVGSEVYAFRRLASLDRYPICSWVVAEAYAKALGLSFGLPANEAAPDDIWRFITARRWIWDLVAEGAAS
jgi:hypothetical protein